MGDTLRTAAAEHRYIRFWLLLGLLLPLLVSGAAAGWMLSQAARLPAALASHWDADGAVDGYASLGATAALTVALATGTGALLTTLAVLLREQGHAPARLGVGFGVAGGLALSALFTAMVAGQLDLVDPSAAAMAAPVLWIGLGVAVVAGALAGVLFRPGQLPHPEHPDVTAQADAVASTDSDVARAGREQAARGETLTVRVSMGGWVTPVSVAVAVAAAVGLASLSPWLAPLGLVPAAVFWVFSRGTVTIGPAGLTVRAGGLLRLMPARWSEVRSATVIHVRALEFGGWGYRLTGGSAAFIMRSGPALSLETTFHQRLVMTMPSPTQAGAAAALATAYAAGPKLPS